MRVVVIGAGLAGLTAGRQLSRAGHEVVVVDKGRGPGGRMATRRIGAATLDHGAQFFTIRSDDFAAFVQPHLDSGLVYEWSRGFAGHEDGYPRYAVRGGMNKLSKELAATLDVRCNAFAFAVRPAPSARDAWHLTLDDGTVIAADVAVLTCPLPQSYSLLITAELSMPEDIRTDYDRTLALLLVLDRPPAVDEPGGVQNPSETISFVADNQRKGISDRPALTIHASATWSETNWDLSAETVTEALLAEAADFVGQAEVVEAQLKRWRFATPRTIWPEPCWINTDAPGPIALAGDAFAGPRVEGAVLSGLAAARAINEA
jgi:renalase